MITITTHQARVFLLKKQFLFPPTSLSGKEAIETVFSHLRIIQFDPLNPCGRNPDLVLQSRIRNIHPDDYHDWLYKSHKGIECYDKVMCIIPVEDSAFSEHFRERFRNGDRIGSFKKKHQEELNVLLQKIEKNGPLCSSDIDDGRTLLFSWGTTSTWSRAALESLWQTGELVIVKRERGRKYYDLPHKVYGENYTPGGKLAIDKEHILRRLNSVGLLPKRAGSTGWLGLGEAKHITRLINELLEERKLVEVSITAVKQHYILLATDLASLELITPSTLPPSSTPMVFLAPLDNLLWDRTMVREIFNFDYKWEVYVPGPKRKYGYYVLPILYGEQFIGRIEPVVKGGALAIRGLWLEKEQKWDNKTQAAFKSALLTFKTYCLAKEIVWKCAKPKNWQD